MVSWLIPGTSSLLFFWSVATTSELLASDVAGQDNWKLQISPVLFQVPETLLAPWHHSVFERYVLPLLLRKVLRLTRISCVMPDLCSYRPKTLNAVFPCMTSEGKWSPWSNRSKLGLSMHMQLFPTGIVWKKPCPEMGLDGKNWRLLPRVAVSLGLRESPQHITLLAMDKQSFHLSSEVSGHSAGWWEICLVPKSTLALNGRLCAQPQWSRPWRKHWAPKHLQAVNSSILLTRASSNIWEQTAATPCSCPHR